MGSVQPPNREDTGEHLRPAGRCPAAGPLSTLLLPLSLRAWPPTGEAGGPTKQAPGGPLGAGTHVCQWHPGLSPPRHGRLSLSLDGPASRSKPPAYSAAGVCLETGQVTRRLLLRALQGRLRATVLCGGWPAHLSDPVPTALPAFPLGQPHGSPWHRLPPATRHFACSCHPSSSSEPPLFLP